MDRAEAPGPVEAGVLAHLGGLFSVRFADAGGARLRYLDGGDGPTLVLLHGRGQAAPAWLPCLTALARRHRVIAVDLPGFGRSSTPPIEPDGPEAALAFFLDPVEALLSSIAQGPAAVVGHSLGGLLAVELALRGRLPLDRLGLIAPMGLGPSMTFASRAFFRLGPERLARLLGRKGFSVIDPVPPTPMGERLHALGYELLSVPGGRPRAAAAFNALFPLLGPPFHRRERLGEVDVPTLIIWGEQDQVFPVADARPSAARFRSARLHVLPLRHSPHLERPDQVLPLLLDFLRST